MKAQAEQAKEHDEKQDKVGNGDGEGSRFAALDVERRAGILLREPRGAGLQMDVLNLDSSKHVQVNHLPARHLISKAYLYKISQ